MTNYSWISIIALFCYLFLFMSFLAAKKSKVIYSFMFIQLIMILCNGGSFLMRKQFWPSVEFWNSISILGIFLLPCAYFKFLCNFLEEKRSKGFIFWLFVFVILFLINQYSGIFVPVPEVVMRGGRAAFIYNYTGWVMIVFLLVGICVAQMGLIVYRYCRKDTMILKQLSPFLLGALVMSLGNLLSTIEIFRGFPVDILSGVIFALLTFYALYEKKLFRMKLLISRGNCYTLAFLITVLWLSNGIGPLQSFFRSTLSLDDSTVIIIVSLCLLLSVLLVYGLMKRFFDALFIKDEQIQAKNLKDFNTNISKTLNMDEILNELVGVIQRTFSVDRVLVCIKNDRGQFIIQKTANPLDEKNMILDSDHPLIRCLRDSNGCMLMSDFVRTTNYRSMWEKEKQQFMVWDIACMVAMRDENDLVGIAMLSSKPKNKQYDYDDISFLLSVSSVCTMAVKNSRLYEIAYYEARYDELTGLLNRKCFYEVIGTEVEKAKEHTIALVMFSVDDFKLYNQLYGTAEGDIALQGIAKIIKAATPENGYSFRMNGKEFAVLLPGYDIYSAKVLAENVCRQVHKMGNATKHYSMKQLTMSAGVCAMPFMASSAKELIENTDMAVYTVKRTGKNAVLMYSEDVGNTSREDEGDSAFTGKYNDYASTIVALTATIDTKDHYTFSHSQNVAYYSSKLAKAYGMNQEFIEIIKEAGLLHDIGKIGIPENILNKQGKLSDDEYEIMKGHVENSIGIIRHLPSLDYVIPAVISHHERYDGRGYPRGIAGEDIPLMGRMLCISDCFDAMISERSYKTPMPVNKALDVLMNEAGRQFDPKLVPIFVGLVEDGTIQIQKRIAYSEEIV